jgi:hypothetical protein
VQVKEFTGNDDLTSHFIEVDFGPTTQPLAPGAMHQVAVTLTREGAGGMNQLNDHSFISSGQALALNTTLYRNGVLIWGDEPGDED